MKKYSLIFSGILIAINCSFSQTHIPGGNVSGTWTQANSPYFIDGNIAIGNSSTLTIEPGVEVWFSDYILGYSFIVEGRLIAEGTELDSIFFYAVDTTNRWNGISFYKLDNNSMDSSRVCYCHFEYANGALGCDSSSKINISNSLFINNRGNWLGGFGGINCYYSSPRIDQVIVKRSIVESGGGMNIHNESHPYISNTVISNNYVTDKGGGIYIYVDCNPILKNVDIANNTAVYGGGIYSHHFNNPIFENVEIYYNSASAQGGGMYINSGFDAGYTNITIRDNHADIAGGGIHTIWTSDTIYNAVIYGNSAANGGGIYSTNGDPVFDHLTLYNNTSSFGGGGIHVYNNANPVMNNSIIWNNSPHSYYNDDPATCSFDATYSDIEGGTAYTWFGTGCIDTDPDFENPGSEDFRLTWAGYPYFPRSGCINTGDPSSSSDDDGSITDMGAKPYYISGTYISDGDYCGTWTSDDSPFIVEGEVNVPIGCELLIEPDVKVVFWQPEAFNVYGRLLAEGSAHSNIEFTVGWLGWKGIKFYNTNSNGQDSSLIERAHIHHVFYLDNNSRGGGLFFQNSSDVKILNCEISNCNIGGYVSAGGAGIYCYESSPVIRNIIIHDCDLTSPETMGCAIYCYNNSSPEITRALIFNNHSDATNDAFGGGIACEYSSDPELSNVTITQNTMDGSYKCGGALSINFCNPVVTNCIFYNNDSYTEVCHLSSLSVFTYSNIEGGTSQPWFGTGCIDADPLFADPASENFQLTWDNYPVPDATKSPCINSGNPASPNDPDGTQADMGAYYWHHGTHICGEIFTDTWTLTESPYIIDCYSYVNSSSTLTIEPGVDVIFSGHYKLDVFGELDADGDVANRITFSAMYPSQSWHGIRFINTNTNGLPNSNLTYCLISGCEAYGSTAEDNYGGAIYCDNSDLWVLHDMIYYNFAESKGGAIYCLNSWMYLANNLITSNSTNGKGGGIYCENATVDMLNDKIYDNTSNDGGGLYFASCNPDVEHLLLSENTASVGGGAVLDNTSGSFITATIVDNSAEWGGGLVCLNSANPTLEKITISENTATSLGGGIYCLFSNPVLNNGIVWNNYSPQEIYLGDDGDVSATYSDIKQPDLSVWPGTGNISEDPIFVDPSGGDFNLSWSDFPDPFTKSPCIDMGDPALENDPDGTRADMGALPYDQTYTPLTSGDISGTLTCADSPYFIFGNLTVPVGDELIIEPCVNLIFHGKYYLQVEGRLLAEGTEEDKIIFYPTDWKTGWQGIRFYNLNSNGQDSSKMVHCQIINGNADGFGDLSYGGGVFATQSSKLLIDQCYFYSNQADINGGAIHLKNGSSPDIRNSLFRNNYATTGGGAIHCYNNVNTVFQNCYFVSNAADYGGAVFVSSCGPEFSGSTIINNHAHKFGGAIYHSGGQFITFDETNRNSIYDNYADYAGLDFYTAADVYIPPVHDLSLDTASVASMNQHFAYPLHLFNINSNYARFVQEDSDLYVSTSGSDLNSGTSAADPLKTIKMALIKIVADSVNPKTIHLADSVYSPAVNGETLPINHRSHVTLSGESRANTRIFGFHRYRLLVSYADINDSVKGVTFEEGYKYGDGGGAVVIENNSNPVFHDITFRNNFSTHDGGAIWCFDDCSPVFSHVSFLDNYADNASGAIWCQSIDKIMLDSVSFESNESRYSGGGLYVDASEEASLYRCIFSSNNLLNGGGGGAAFRGVHVILDSVEFNANNTIGDGGGLFADYNADIEMKNCSFVGNAASGSGGGLYFYLGVDIEMENVIFTHNSSVSGGAIWGYYQSSLDINNGLFLYNNTLYHPHSDGNGGALDLRNVETNLTNVTLSGNVADGDGGGLYCWASSAGVNYTVQNSIIFENNPDQIFVDYNAVVNVDFCDVEDGWPSGIGNINQDPLYSAPFTGDYSLNAASPCINAGNLDTTGMNLPMFDLAENPRISNDTIDMGTYEFFQGIELDLKVFLEGPFNGTTMNTDLTNSTSSTILPIKQPYNTPPWNYSGTEEVFSTFPNNTVDWILLQVRDTTDVALAIPASIKGRQAVFLLSDGSIVDINGSNPRFGNPIEHQCYIAVLHRNHLGIISSTPLAESGGTYSYDFTSGSSQAYGTDAQKDLGGGIFGMYAGDADANGIIELDDKTLFWSLEAGRNGYLNSDFNLDSQTNNNDKNDIWNNNTGNSSQIPD